MPVLCTSQDSLLLITIIMTFFFLILPIAHFIYIYIFFRCVVYSFLLCPKTTIKNYYEPFKTIAMILAIGMHNIKYIKWTSINILPWKILSIMSLQSWTSKYLSIEDPFDLNHNLGAGVSRKMANFIIRVFMKARHHFGTDCPPDVFSQSVRDQRVSLLLLVVNHMKAT